MSPRNSQGSYDEGKPKEEILEEVASSGEGIVIDEATNKRIVRKIDWQLMPIVWSPPPLFSFPSSLVARSPCIGHSLTENLWRSIALLHLRAPIL